MTTHSARTWRPSPVDRVRASVYGSGDSLDLIFAEPQSDPNIRGNFDLSTQFHRFFLGWTRALTDDVDQDLQLAVGPTLLDFTLGPDLGFHASTIQIEARQAGLYRGQCAEFCGLQHANMAFLVVAQPQAEFDEWLRTQAKSARPPPDQSAEAGQQVFLGSACVYCHRIAGTNASGRVGPDLTHLASRRMIGAALLPNTRGYLAELLVAFLRRDYRAVADVQFRAGYVPSHQSREVFAQACRSIGEPIFGRALREISFASLLGQLFALGQTFEIEVQPQLLLLQKNMLMAEGVSRALDPNLNIWTLAQPLIEEWMRENRGPEARLRDALEDAAFVVRRLPRLVAEAERALVRLAEGGVKLHAETLLALERRDRRNRHRWIGWIVALGLGALALAWAWSET